MQTRRRRRGDNALRRSARDTRQYNYLQGRDNVGQPAAKFANYWVHATELADAIDRLSAKIRADHYFIDSLGQTATLDDANPRWQRPHEL
jgi:hypothetical protein